MATFQEQLKKVKRVNKTASIKFILDSLKGLNALYAPLNVHQIEDLKENIKGDEIGFYSYATEELTGGLKREGDPFDLYITGDLLASLFTKIKLSLFEEEAGVVFGFTDPKLPEVKKSVDFTDVLGLNEENFEGYVSIPILKKLLTFYRKKLDL